MKYRILFLVITSTLIATGLGFSLLFVAMLFGGKWSEPNQIIAGLELLASILVVGLGFTGWIIVVKRKLYIEK